MKKSTLKSLVSLLNGEAIENADEIKAELEAELNRGAEKAQANRDLYDSAHDVVIEALRTATAPVTIGELYEAVADELPEGMTKGKVQYAVTRLWVDEIAKTEGKVNTYSLR
jgi:Mg/Co/Ni transporter MgtE